MGERVRPTRSGLIAIELVIAVGVFALCAAISTGLFVRSDVMSRESGDLTRAVGQARAVAECYKAAGGDMEETGALLGEDADGEYLLLSYDGQWERVDRGEDAAFSLTLTPAVSPERDIREAELRVTGQEGEEILTWTVAALEVTG